jgi:hypothetical protein
MEKEKTGKRKFTTGDARLRIMCARFGCLEKNRVTREYLEELRSEIYKWGEKIDQVLLTFED